AQHHTIIVHERLGLVHAVRDGAHGGACQALALREDELDTLGEGLSAVALEELGDAALPRAYRRNLRPEVAHGTVREPAVGAQDGGEFWVLAAGFEDLHEGELQAFCVNVARDTTKHPTDVRP